MKKLRIILNTALLILALGTLASRSASLGQLTQPKSSSNLLTARLHHGRLFWRTSKNI